MAYVITRKVRYRSDNTGREKRLKAIFTEHGLLISHLRYLADSKKSRSWQEVSVQAVVLLIKFTGVNEDRFNKTVELLRAFSEALYTGTVNIEDLSDPSGLFWRPRTAENAKNILQHLTSYTDWLSLKSEYQAVCANPFRPATAAEERMNRYAYFNRLEHVFLGHLELADQLLKDSVSRAREVAIWRGSETASVTVVKRFPTEHIRRLFDVGFIRGVHRSSSDVRLRTDYKCQAITLLLHYGGLRKSEALHLYLNDIDIDHERKRILVRCYHPELGAAPEKGYVNRMEYLSRKYMLPPRNQYPASERLRLGWKAPALDKPGKCFEVQFFPPEKATEFLSVFVNYLRYQRVEPKLLGHPYAFTNENGGPETLKNFQRLHRAAVERIGLECRKDFGTTEHGHRHAYGYRLRSMGFTREEIQKAMHHRNPESSLVYTAMTDEEFREMMQEKVEAYGRY